jgi:hypothetical protein
MKYKAYMEFKKLSIKNFIGDLPNIVNTNFEKVSDFIYSIFNEDTNTIHAKGAIIENQVTANSVITNNLIISDSDGKTVSFAEMIERLEKLEQNNNEN